MPHSPARAKMPLPFCWSCRDHKSLRSGVRRRAARQRRPAWQRPWNSDVRGKRAPNRVPRGHARPCRMRARRAPAAVPRGRVARRAPAVRFLGASYASLQGHGYAQQGGCGVLRERKIRTFLECREARLDASLDGPDDEEAIPRGHVRSREGKSFSTRLFEIPDISTRGGIKPTVDRDVQTRRDVPIEERGAILLGVLHPKPRL